MFPVLQKYVNVNISAKRRMTTDLAKRPVILMLYSSSIRSVVHCTICNCWKRVITSNAKICESESPFFQVHLSSEVTLDPIFNILLAAMHNSHHIVQI